MSEDKPAAGVLTRAELAAIASLFDRFEFSDDPLSLAAREAESQFNHKVSDLYRGQIAGQFSSITEVAFRAKIKTICRALIRKQCQYPAGLRAEDEK